MRTWTGLIAATLSLAATPALAVAPGTTAPSLFGAPVEFYLFGLTLLGVAVLHHRPLTVALTGLAVLTSRALPRWSGAIAVLAGAAFVAEGVAVSSGGFSGTGLPGLVSWPLLVAFTVVTTAAAWRGPRRWGGPVAPTLDRGVGR